FDMFRLACLKRRFKSSHVSCTPNLRFPKRRQLMNKPNHQNSSYAPMSAESLKKRGWCCGCGCRYCPYDYVGVPEPIREEKRRRRALLDKASDCFNPQP